MTGAKRGGRQWKDLDLFVETEQVEGVNAVSQCEWKSLENTMDGAPDSVMSRST